jgi:beta-galactosidase
MTGNLGGEQYRDRVRGPLNEGGLFAERQGYHLPGSPTESWNTSSPFETGLRSAGVGFYATSFELDLPAEYDIPIDFVFDNTTTPDYRVQLFVNGYQFGKFCEYF